MYKPPRAHKYNASKTVLDGVQYDSKREAYMRQLLNGIPNAQIIEKERIELQAGFRNHLGEAIRAIYIEPDYKLVCNGLVIFIDVKGMITPDYKIKWKILQFKQDAADKIDLTKSYFFTPQSNKACLEVRAVVQQLLGTELGN